MEGKSGREEQLLGELAELRGRIAEWEAREAERQEREKTLQEREELYRRLFENSPTSLWVEDLSALKVYIDNLRASGVRDLRAHFERHPEALRQCASMVKVLDVNRITLALYQGKSKEEFPSDLSAFLGEGSYEALKELIICLSEGKEMSEAEAVNRTMTGDHMDIVLRWSILPGHKETWTRILISVIDITERKRWETALREYTERLRAMGSRVEQIQEAGRHQIVRVLHDQVGQNLTALGLNLNILRSKIPTDLEASTASRLDDSLILLGETMQCIRNVMTELRPPTLDEYGLVAALRWYAERFSQRTGTPILIKEENPGPRLLPAAEISLFRIAQEALTNVSKHARAGQVVIRVESLGEAICLTIADNGVGFEIDALHSNTGEPKWGLMTMRERAEAMGGQLRVESSPGKGTRVIVEVPRS